MKNWIKKNLKNIVATAFVIPILLVAYVSISHVTSFYGLSNPFSWAVYLSVAIEIAALSALAAVSVKMGKFVYVPFLIVTLIQFVGNLYFSFTYIDETSDSFKEWMNMVGGMLEPMGIDPTDVISHKRVLAFFSGGLLPLISLTFAHMLVVFTDNLKESEQVKQLEEPKTILPNKEISDEELYRLSREAGRIEYENSLKDKENNFGDLDKIEEYLIGLQSIKNEDKVETIELNDTQIVPDEVEEETPIVLDEIKEEIQVDEVTNDGVNDGIKRLVYSGRNG
jgi:hypothetical protein